MRIGLRTAAEDWQTARVTEEKTPVRAARAPWWLVAVLVVIAIGGGLGAGALLWAGEPARSPEPSNGDARTLPSSSCINLYFYSPDPDTAMLAAIDQLRGDPRFETRQGRDQEELFAEFKAIFAKQPELVKLASKEAMPASVRVKLRDSAPRAQTEEQLREAFPEATVVEGYCP
jgi:FtsX extracellular domain